MKLAFLILAHKNPAQLTRLVNYLLLNDCAVLIHIDKKSEKEFENFNIKFKDNKNVKIYSRFKVYWGSYNQIRATFFLLNEAMTNFKFDYVNLISGMDLPVKKIKDFKHFLEQANGKDYISVFKADSNNPWAGNGGLDRMRLFWITDFNENLKFFFSKLNVVVHKLQHAFKLYRKTNTDIYGGANWFTLSHKTAGFVDQYLQNNTSFVKMFENTRCADEIILGTIIMNSEHRSNVENNYLRYIDWQTGPEYPRTFRQNDFERLMEMENIFFARKFDEKTDNDIIDKIYKQIITE